jgi:hypothetical protein
VSGGFAGYGYSWIQFQGTTDNQTTYTSPPKAVGSYAHAYTSSGCQVVLGDGSVRTLGPSANNTVAGSTPPYTAFQWALNGPTDYYTVPNALSAPPPSDW